MTVLFPVLLSIYSLTLASGQEPSPPAESSSLQFSAIPTGQVSQASRHLETNSTSSCAVLHCESCELSNQTCKSCLSGYKLNDGGCSNPMEKSSSSLTLVPLICLIIGLIIFSVIFCGVCIFLARKRKPRYSGHRNIDGEVTKSVSMINDFFSDEVQSPSTLLHSPDNENSVLPPDSNVIRRRLLRHIYKSLPTLPKSKRNTGECSICFELLTFSDLKLLKCEHLFHRNCCREWMKMGKGNCPTCGVEIN